MIFKPDFREFIESLNRLKRQPKTPSYHENTKGRKHETYFIIRFFSQLVGEKPGTKGSRGPGFK
jgi:hypothetical protein